MILVNALIFIYLKLKKNKKYKLIQSVEFLKRDRSDRKYLMSY